MRPAVFAACFLLAALGQTGCDLYPRAGHLADAFPPTVEPTVGISRTLPRPVVAGLIWVKAPSENAVSALLPEAAVRRVLTNAVRIFDEQGNLLFTRVFLPSDFPTAISRPVLRKFGEATGLDYLLVISPSGRDRSYPVTLRIGRDFLFPGLRRDFYLLVEGGLFEVRSGQFLFTVVGRGTAVLDAAAPGFEGTTSRYPQVYRWAFGNAYFGIRYPTDSPEVELGVQAGELAMEDLISAIKGQMASLQ
jgi:hypothetical protein